LESLFTANPLLLADDRTAFLAEGSPVGERVSVEPLVEVDPQPSDEAIEDILGTYLIPGYVAYEWKHQQSIPILGVEDDLLYQTCARAWVQSNSRTADPAANPLLFRYTVGARNRSIADTLIVQLRSHASPILFVGLGHVGHGLGEYGFLHPAQFLRSQNASADLPGQFAALVRPDQLDRLRQAGNQGLSELLRPRGIGFVCLGAKGDPLPEPEVTRTSVVQYLALIDAQLSGNTDIYIQDFGEPKTTTSGKSSPKKAANYYASTKSGGNKKGGKNGGGGQGGGKAGIGQKIVAILNIITELVFGKGAGPELKPPPGPGWPPTHVTGPKDPGGK
jgi:hypothetical protein